MHRTISTVKKVVSTASKWVSNKVKSASRWVSNTAKSAVDLIGGYIDDLFDRSTPKKMAEALKGYDPNVCSGYTIAP